MVLNTNLDILKSMLILIHKKRVINMLEITGKTERMDNGRELKICFELVVVAYIAYLIPKDKLIFLLGYHILSKSLSFAVIASRYMSLTAISSSTVLSFVFLRTFSFIAA